MCRGFRLLCFIVSFLAFLPQTTRADTYVVGVEDYPHLPHFAVEKGEMTGLTGEILAAYSKASADTFVFRTMPVKRLQKALEDGEIDFRYPDNPNWYSEAKVGKGYLYSDALSFAVARVYVLPDHVGQPLKRLGVPLGYNPIEFRAAVDAGEVVIVNSPKPEGLINMVRLGRIDGVYGNRTWIHDMMQRVGVPEGTLVFDPGLPHSSHDFQMSTVAYGDVLQSLNRWLSDNRPLINALHKRYKITEQ